MKFPGICSIVKSTLGICARILFKFRQFPSSSRFNLNSLTHHESQLKPTSPKTSFHPQYQVRNLFLQPQSCFFIDVGVKFIFHQFKTFWKPQSLQYEARTDFHYTFIVTEFENLSTKIYRKIYFRKIGLYADEIPWHLFYC